MYDLVIAASALVGIAIIAVSGSRFMVHEDDRLERVALGDSPAAWGTDTADATLVR